MVLRLHPHHRCIICLLSVHGSTWFHVDHELGNRWGLFARHMIAAAFGDTQESQAFLHPHPQTEGSQMDLCHSHLHVMVNLNMRTDKYCCRQSAGAFFRLHSPSGVVKGLLQIVSTGRKSCSSGFASAPNT